MDVLSISSDGVGIIWDLHTRAVRGGLRECVPTHRGICGVAHANIVSALVSVETERPALNVCALGRDAPLYKCSMSEKMTCVAASNDGRLIAAGGASGAISVWSASTGELLRVWSGHYRAVSALTFSPCDSALVSGGQDALIHVWDVPSCIDVAALADVASQPVPFASFSEHALGISCLVFGPGLGLAARLVSGSADSTVRVWDLPTKRCVLACTFPAPVHAAVLDPLEHNLYAAAADGVTYTTSFHVAMARYDARPAAPTLVQHAGSATAAALASILSSARADALATPNAEHAFVGHTGPVVDVALTADTALLITASQDHTVRIWDTTSFQCMHVFDAHHAEVRAVLLLPKAAVDGAQARARGSASISDEVVPAAAVVAPLKKHPTAMPVEWRGSTTGPVDKDEIVALAPHVASLAEADTDMREYNQALGQLLAEALHQSSCASGQGRGAEEGHADEIEALRARVAELEKETDRWKVVNNKLMARLQTGATGPAPPAEAGTKRGPDGRKRQ